EKGLLRETIGMTGPGLNGVDGAGHELPNLTAIFAAGVEEVRAWPVMSVAITPQAGAGSDSDFGNGVISRHVLAYLQVIQFKGEAGVNEAGKWRLEGKEYIVKDGDVMHFRFNV